MNTARPLKHAAGIALAGAFLALPGLASAQEPGPVNRAQHRDIQVLAVFFGGQDHQRRMLVRLLQKL